MTALDFDTTGFLQAVDALGRRLDRAVEGGGPAACARTGPAWRARSADRLDEGCELYEAAVEVFGFTDWATAICAAPYAAAPDLACACRRFLDGSAAVVTRHGMSVWLYDLLNDAAKAVATGEPSAHMPRCVAGEREVRGCSAGSGAACGCEARDGAACGCEAGSGTACGCAARSGAAVGCETGNGAACGCAAGMEGPDGGACRGEPAGEGDGAGLLDHAMQMHRLAAYCALRWGGREPRSLAIAQLLLDNPGLGMCMLREDDEVRAMGAMPDLRYRRAVDYLKELRAQADLEYAKALAGAGGPRPTFGRMPGFGAVDARYLYDARRVVSAYRALWDEPTASGGEVLERVERVGVRPVVPLWRNAAYLDDLARSLMGASFAADLVVGFAERDEERFREGADQLDEFADFVETVGFVALPGVVLGTYALDVEEASARSEREWNRERRVLASVGGSMASVALARMPDEDVARKAATAMIACDTARYMALVMDLLDGAPAEAG